MGDRGNVYVREDETSGVYLYTHWSGSELPTTVRDALVRGDDRHSDGQYLARVVFCEMLHGDTSGTTGYGISANVGDNNYPIVVLDPHAQTVSAAKEGQERAGPYVGTMLMKSFAALSEGDLDAWWDKARAA